MHSTLRLQDWQTPEYHQTLALRWDVDPKDAIQIDEETQEGSVGVRLPEATPYIGSDSNSSSNFDTKVS